LARRSPSLRQQSDAAAKDPRLETPHGVILPQPRRKELSSNEKVSSDCPPYWTRKPNVTAVEPVARARSQHPQRLQPPSPSGRGSE
ncbi:MAG: hypothetical protein C4340_05885, partial [Armatimonadota bacterium]